MQDLNPLYTLIFDLTANGGWNMVSMMFYMALASISIAGLIDLYHHHKRKALQIKLDNGDIKITSYKRGHYGR